MLTFIFKIKAFFHTILFK